MSQPVKLSDSLVLDARLVGEILERSIAGQVEYWARLGRAVEALMDGTQALALCRSGAAVPVSEALELVGTPAGRRRVAEVLLAEPYPHYEPVPGSGGLLVRIEAGGKRTTGRFVNRQFKAARAKKTRR